VTEDVPKIRTAWGMAAINPLQALHDACTTSERIACDDMRELHSVLHPAQQKPGGKGVRIDTIIATDGGCKLFGAADIHVEHVGLMVRQLLVAPTNRRRRVGTRIVDAIKRRAGILNMPVGAVVPMEFLPVQLFFRAQAFKAVRFDCGRFVLCVPELHREFILMRWP